MSYRMVPARCPECEHEWDVPYDFDEADDSVGAGPGACVGDDPSCPECGYQFGAEDTRQLEEKATTYELESQLDPEVPADG